MEFCMAMAKQYKELEKLRKLFEELNSDLKIESIYVDYFTIWKYNSYHIIVGYDENTKMFFTQYENNTNYITSQSTIIELLNATTKYLDMPEFKQLSRMYNLKELI